jgi:murein DD-endopeptidase MepM/ murein hydrolase activator NlpD
MWPYVQRYGNYQPFGHAGMDIACPEGTEVRAIAAGTVLWADWGTSLPGDETDAGYRRRWYLYKGFPGIVTLIQHPDWISVYAHLSRADLNPGDRVTEGQRIGLSGGTGGVDPHLHVEALVNMSYRTGGGLIYGRTDPAPYFGSLHVQAASDAPIPAKPRYLIPGLDIPLP